MSQSRRQPIRMLVTGRKQLRRAGADALTAAGVDVTHAAITPSGKTSRWVRSRSARRLSCLTLLAMLLAPAAGEAAVHGSPGRIAFVADRQLRPAQLVTVDAAGAHRRRVAYADASDLLVARDGAFAIDRGPTDKLYLSDARGMHRIGNGQPFAFSPDGATLLVYEQNGDKWEVLDRLTGSVRLTVSAKSGQAGEYFFSDWAGDDLYFTVTTDNGSHELHAIRSDGTGDQLIAKAESQALPSPDGRWVAYTSDTYASPPGDGLLHLVRPDGTDDRVLGEVGELLAWSPDSSQIAVVTPENRVAFLALDGTIRPSKSTADTESSGEWSPDGGRFAVATSNGALAVVDAATGKARRVAAHGGLFPSWSPDGRTLLVSGDDPDVTDFAVVPAAGGALRPLDPDIGGGAAWLPSGRLLLALDTHRIQQLATIAPEGGRVRFIPGTQHDLEPAWSPDGKRLAFTSPSKNGWVIGVCDADGTHRREIARSDRSAAGPSWSPDGRFIAYIRTNGIYIVASTGGRPRLVTRALDLLTVAWSPDGRQLAFGDDNVMAVYVVGIDGKNTRLVVHTGGYTGGVAWSPDGTRLALNSQVRDVETLVTVDLRTHHRSEVAPGLTDPSWSPTGDRIVGTLEAHTGEAQTIAEINLHGSSPPHVLALGTDPSWQPRGSTAGH